MKSVLAAGLFSGLAAAHSAVWSVTVDGAKYPARDIRSDNILGAKRIEWKFDNAFNIPWHAITDVESKGFACGDNPHQPELKAYARAGSNVTVQWSNVIRMHNGPLINYLGAWNGPSQKPTEVEFFKISEAGYDKARRKWSNEDLIDSDTAQTFQLPSDIKPGMYILRTELLALHGNAMSYMPSEGTGPQFYIHCFNLDISGNGNVVPKGVKFPGAYKRTDPGVKFNLYRGGQSARDNYVIPGPPKYAGKYEAPPATTAARAVTDAERGLFPAAFEAKYELYRTHSNQYAIKSADFVNMGQPGTRMKSGLGREALQDYFRSRPALNAELTKELEALRVEAVQLGLVKG